MTKAMGLSEQFVLNGKWTWNASTNTLECISSNNNSDKSDKKGREKHKQRPGMFQESHGKRPGDRGATPSIGSRAFGQGRQSRVLGHRSAVRQHHSKQAGDNANITLERVKELALSMLSKVDDVAISFQDGIYSTEQFDEFLLFLINFYHCFFEKRTQEQKPNPMNIEPSLKEKQYYEDLCLKLEASQKQLGKAYCVVVLGIGLSENHHMACGQSRVSSTYQDRMMFETLYSFCTFVVWISFKRREYEVIKKELGRMLRSDTFNPAIRVKNAPPVDATDDGKSEKKPEKKMTPAEYRRTQGNRPPIKSIINQRSPALVSILPSPKEEAHWLFRTKRALSPTALGEIGHEELSEDTLVEQFQHLKIDVSKLKRGIIGEPLSQYNTVTLVPLDGENEEENTEDDKNLGTRRESQVGLSTIPPKSPQSQEDGISRQQTALSNATTEAMSDED